MNTADQNDHKTIKDDIDDYFGKDISSEDRGAAYAQFANMYMQTHNRINRAYLKALTTAINLLKSVNSKEREAGDMIDQAEIKSRIQRIAV